MAKATQKEIDDARRAMAADSQTEAGAIAAQVAQEEADNAAAYELLRADHAQGIRNKPFSDYVAAARADREQKTQTQA